MLTIAIGLLGFGIALPLMLKGRNTIIFGMSFSLSSACYSLILWLESSSPPIELDKDSLFSYLGSTIACVGMAAGIMGLSRFGLLYSRSASLSLRICKLAGAACLLGTCLFAITDTWLFHLNPFYYELLWALALFMLPAWFVKSPHTGGIGGTTEAVDMSSSFRVASSGIEVLNHAFKNKLLTMEMAAGTIKAKLPNHREVEEELSLIEQSVEHMNQMVLRIRERTRNIMLREQSHNLRTLVEACLSELRAVKPESITITVDPLLNVLLFCDPVHIKEVLYNLLTNSLEAMGQTGGTIRIYRGENLPGGWFTLVIADTGPGIPLVSANRIFEPYFTTKAGRSNFGLGLSYCYNVMKASSGTIKVNSQEGHGTSVILGFHPKKVLAYPHVPT